jgi:hypothetical protein
MKAWLLLLFLTSALINDPTHDHGKWIIDNTSQLRIHGETNVNTFTCYINCYNNVDTLAYSRDEKKDELTFSKNKMIIPVYNFTCGNALITQDFRQTVKGNKFPYLNIGFISLRKDKEGSHAHGTMQIDLAGVTRQVNIQFDIKPNGQFIELTGKHQVCFADFGLAAPSRVMGLIKVQETLTVEFNLLIRQV